MSKKMTNQEFIKKVYDKVGEEYTVLGEYKNSKTKIKMRHNCKECNNYEWELTANNFLNIGNRCPVFGKNRKTTELFKKEVYNLVKDEYTVLGEYINTDTKILIRHNCDKCNNYEYKIRPHDFLRENGTRCPKCAGLVKKTTEQFKQEVHDIVGDEYTVLGEYKNSKTKILIRHNCDKCNNYEWKISPISFLKGTRCPKCAGLVKKTTEQFKQEVKELTANEYSVLGRYVNADTKILIRHNCKECDNYEYEVRPYDFIKNNGNRCPKCAMISQTSKAEKEIVSYIKSIYNKEIIENDRNILNGKELDIYLPDIKLAIEYNGCYFHNIDHIKNKLHHLNKYNLCKKKGIMLITIWEDEYLKNKKKYYNIISSFINNNINNNIYNIIYKNNLLYINKDYENVTNIIYDDKTMKKYMYIGDTLPEIIIRKNNYCWNIGYKIYKKI